MSTPRLVADFYSHIWESRRPCFNFGFASKQFCFRGSLGVELHGLDAFREYVQSVRGALADYHCEILDCVTERNRAFAKMRFAGIHVAPFRGYEPTGRTVHWLGAALFRLDGDLIGELWVLGDLVGLDAVLQANAKAI